MHYRFLGTVADCATARPASTGWNGCGSNWAFTLKGSTPGARVYPWDSMLLLLRGVIHRRGDQQPADLDLLASEIREHYLETGSLPTDRLEGAFNVVLLDGMKERVLLYRNRAASGAVFYRISPAGFAFSSNLADLLSWNPEMVGVRKELLPAFYLHGTTPGRDTLLSGCQRLLSGELLRWERGRIARQTVEANPPAQSHEQPGSLEDCLDEVLRDVRALRGRTATLLTGHSSDTALLSAWTRTAREELLPTTFSASIEGESGLAATERVMWTSRALGSEHRLIPVESCLPESLRSATLGTAEPQLGTPGFWLSLLGPAVERQGFDAALVGLGAPEQNSPPDSHSHRSWWRTLTRIFRSGARTNSLDQNSESLDTESVRLCFGEAGLREAREAAGDPLNTILEAASQAITLYNLLGLDLICPFLDSRVLSWHASSSRQTGTVGPLVPWMMPGGILRSLVEQLPLPEFLDESVQRQLLRRPTRFLAHLLAHDLWNRWIVEAATRPPYSTLQPTSIPEAA